MPEIGIVRIPHRFEALEKAVGQHPIKPGRVTVSGQLGDDMPKGTLASVKRQAGLRGERS
jgi:hypothetical protein